MRKRKMTQQDVPGVAQLAQSVMPIPWSEKTFLDCFGQRYHNLVLEEENEIIGFLVLHILNKEVEIMNVAIAPEYQHQGLGSKLLEEEIFQQHFEKVWLEVRNSNKAVVAFYEKLGFIEISRRKNYYQNKEDAIVMQLT